MNTLFIRERRKVDAGERKPRFRVVAATGDFKFFAKHLRKKELEALAAETGVKLVYLPVDGDGKGQGGRQAAG